MANETFEQLVARLNANAYIPPTEPTGVCVMAKQVKLKKGQEFQFKATGGGVQASKYPWDEWFNGELLLIERSDVDADGNPVEGGTKRDFDVETDAMPAKIKTAARRRYKVVQVSRLDADGHKLENGGLIIKARPMTDDEKVHENILRAEEKDKAKDRKAAAADAALADAQATNAA